MNDGNGIVYFHDAGVSRICGSGIRHFHGLRAKLKQKTAQELERAREVDHLALAYDADALVSESLQICRIHDVVLEVTFDDDTCNPGAIHRAPARKLSDDLGVNN